MTKRIPEPRAELSPGIRNHEARLLATMLRTSRLTCVFGEPGTDKTALLKGGVMPLLQRRFTDRHAPGTGGSGTYAGADRRAHRPAAAVRPLIEAAIYFDTWDGDPLAGLLARADAVAAALGPHAGSTSGPLAKTLHDMHRTTGLRIVFLLDRFEEFLARPVDQDESARFMAELVDAVLDPGLPASFLIALDEPARPRLERFRARFPGFDHNSLRLSPIARPTDVDPAEPTLAAEVMPGPTGALRPAAGAPPRRIVPPPRPKHLRGPPPRAPLKVDDVYALIEQTLSRTSARPAPVPTPARAGGAGSRLGAPAPAPLPRREVGPTAGARQLCEPSAEVSAQPREPASSPNGAAPIGDPSAQKALGTFRLAAALGHLRNRRTGGV